MKNKPGFKIKIGSEAMLYIIIGIIIFAFTLFMPSIYKFISDIKTGKAFKSENPPIIDKTQEEKPKPEEKPAELVGDKMLICSSTTSTADGNLIETYTFYYNLDKLTGIKNEKNYDAISDEYLNFAYSEQSKFSNINNLYKTVPGFSYASTFENRNLLVTFLYDLTKLDLEVLTDGTENLTIDLKVNKNQTLEDIRKTYSDLGYSCK